MAFRDLLEELRRPSGKIGAAGIMIGIASIVITIRLAHQMGQISSEVEQTQVFDQSRLQTTQGVVQVPLTLLDAGKKPIGQNVFVAMLKVWNSGAAEIKSVDIRTSFRIIVSKNARVLDTQLVFATRNNADQFKLESAPSESQNHIGFGWDHFDPNEGFTVRLIYASPDEVAVNVDGYAAGSEVNKTVNDLAFLPAPVHSQDRSRSLLNFTEKWAIVLTGIGGFLAVMTMWLAPFRNFAPEGLPRTVLQLAIGGIIGIGLMFAALYGGISWAAASDPPF